MSPRNSTSSQNLHLGPSLTRLLREELGNFCQDSEVRYAAVLEDGGMLCADAGDESLRDAGETAALAVGAFAALQAVAKRLGDESFEGLFHEGKARQFSLLPINPRFLLLSVFQAPVRFAVVKICAGKLIPRLRTALEAPPPARENVLPTPSLPPLGTARALATDKEEDFAFSPEGIFRELA